jgi:uncharacterized protein YidB (DUF937 family)
MSLFDSIISEAGQRFGLGDKSGTLLSALLALITDQSRGGFPGFLDRFSRAGLGDLASSWISSGDNAALSTQQVESALGEETIADIAGQADIDSLTAKSALAYMIPTVVDKLTPDGVVPEDKDLLSKIGDFLSGVGGTVPGPAAATVDLGKPVAVKGLSGWNNRPAARSERRPAARSRRTKIFLTTTTIEFQPGSSRWFYLVCCWFWAPGSAANRRPVRVSARIKAGKDGKSDTSLLFSVSLNS